MAEKRGGLTIMFLPDESGESRSFRLSPQIYRFGKVAAVVAMVFLVLVVGSWGFLAVRTVHSWQLQARVDSLEAERVQILNLAEGLARVETEYENLRLLFGSGETPIAPDLWLPPSGLPGSASVASGLESGESLPTSWPLTQAGYITQPLITGEDVDGHPGLDIAVPRDSYIRAAGAGSVVRTGEDPIYGLFVVLEHGEGYQTVYAHASTILVPRGRRVRRGEVIALSGSTGESTAPHLHFEILLDGLPLDPLSMVEQPG
jgi:murein DD-endopeptidase MepM/ murein hydrolase activator NlpD